MANFTLTSGVLFQGVDATGDIGLWETDGTASGTFELTPITGANASGLSPSNLTVFNGEVLFEGKDSSGQFGLWATNGDGRGHDGDHRHCRGRSLPVSIQA